jgi:uncharacterized membrane protein YphA (DoxX/SURF4 family)
MQELLAPVETADVNAQPWSPAFKIGFRCCFIYAVLYCLSNQILGSTFPIPKFDQPDLSSLPPMRNVVFWVAQHLFRVSTPLVYTGSGSGDKTFDWVLSFCLLCISLIAAAVWSLFDRKRTNYASLSRWLMLIVRVAVVSQLLVYGFVKAVPLQMPYPFLSNFLEPLRNASPMGILWTSVGASPSYEIFAGCAELAGGLLLIFPRTVTLGALVCLADMIQVFMLNMTYDVPVKLFSFHMILFSLLLLAPNFQQLFRFFFSSHPAAIAPPAPLFRSRRANRIAGSVLAFLFLWMIGNNVYGDWSAWHEYGGGRSKPALYGIWEIDQFQLDGKSQPLDASSKTQWRRIIFDFTNYMQIQLMDDSFSGFAASVDIQKKVIALTKASDKKWQANFSFIQPSSDSLVLDGTLDGHKQHLALHLMDLKKFTLASRGFHWIQEYPFNR